jgi:uncharacterized peroxidase-related enzyme
VTDREDRTVADDRISWFPVPEDDELPDDLRKLFAKARENVGFVPNVFRAYAWRPERFRPWFDHFRNLHRGSEHLSEAEREMIAVAVSMANGCLYCLVAHGAALRDHLGDPVQADIITLDYRRADLEPRQRAILDWAVKITTAPTTCEESDLDVLREHGLTDEEIWDVAEVAAMYNFTNRMAMATGQMPNEEYHYLVRGR